MPAYSLLQFSQWLNAPVTEDILLAGVSVDSRNVKPGDLFFALKGDCTDGHLFIEEAAQKGAAAVIVSKQYSNKQSKIPLIPVDDVLEALQLLAKKILELRTVKIVAVTGSIGKTTTKDFIAGLIGHKFKIAASPGNSNSQIGLPLTIINHTTGQEEILVLEMGMTHPGQLSKLVHMVPPDIALITTTSLVHACNFNSLAEIGMAKAEIFSHPKTSLGIIDRNIANFEDLTSIGSCRKISFSLSHPKADFRLRQDGHRLVIDIPDGQVFVDLLPFPGKHNVHNYLAAIVAARHLGLSWEEIQAATPRLHLPERRLQFLEKQGALFVNDSYNASPASLKAALESLPPPKSGGKRIAVIGEMLELGCFSEECHREVGQHALQFIDHMLCFGKECFQIKECWQAAGRPVEWHLERSSIVETLRRLLSPGDVVLLKGSRSKQVWKVLEEL